MIRTRFLRLGTIAVLVGAIPACGGNDANSSQGEIDPVLGVALEGLGAAVADCNGGADTGAVGNFDLGAKTMTVRLSGGGSTVFSVIGNAVTINGWSCFDEDGLALTTTNVRKMNITTDVANDDKLVFDMLPGSFGSIFSATGGVTVDMRKDGDSVAVRGTTAANKMKVGENADADALYLEVSGDNNADIKLSGTGLSETDDNITFLLGEGDDTFIADGASLTAAHIDGTTTLEAVSVTQLVVYGGTGNDTLQGGDYNDTLYGGEGNDTFNAAAADDGDDVIWGGAGTDTMSYAKRTLAVDVTINPGVTATGSIDMADVAYPIDANVSVTGSVNLATGLTYPLYSVNATGSVNMTGLTYPIADGDDLTLTVDGGVEHTVDLNGEANAAAVVATINGDANMIAEGVVASLNANNRLVLSHATDDIDVTNTGSAAALFGLAAQTYSSAGHLTVKVGGGAERTVNLGTGEADADAVVAAINLDADMVSEGVTASLNGSNQLVLSHPTDDIEVTNGETGYTVFGLTLGVYDGSNDLTLRVDGGAERIVNFGNEVSPAAVIATINADADMVSEGVTAYLNTLNQVVLLHATDSIQITNTDSGYTMLGLALATYTGNDANDGDTGGNEADDVRADVENLTGGAGDDLLVGYTNSNTIKGGAGEDTLSGGYGNVTCANDVDVLEGEAGDDIFTMGPTTDCSDDIKGGADTDLVDYQYRSATLVITLNNAAVDGATSENDNVRSDVEQVVGGNAADTITGGAGNETLRGGPGSDTLSGGGGNDTLVGNSGDDTLNGDAGDDTFLCSGDDTSFTFVLAWEDDKGDGDDIMNGGAGTDSVTYAGRAEGLDVSMCTDATVNTGDATSGDAECTDVDGGPAIARLQGTVSIPNGVTNGTMAINIGGGAQTVTFSSDNTAALVAAQINADVPGTTLVASVDHLDRILLTLTGADLTAQTITVTTSAKADAVGFLSGNLTVTATREGDTAVNMEWLVGGDGIDTLAGDTAAETIEGGAAADTITGGDGNDTLYGDAGNDTMSGGNGDDLLNGGAGLDAMSGGAGDGDLCTVLAADSDTSDTCEVL